VGRLSNRVADAVESYLGLTVQPVDFALETEGLVAFFDHAHSASVLLKLVLA
jgi:hypothetical protein